MTTRRANGDGSIRMRSDGRWEARVVVDGKRRSWFGASRQEVTRAMRAAQRRGEEGLPVELSKRSLSSWLPEWLESTRGHVAARTFEVDASRLRLHLLPALGHLELGQLGVHHIEQLLREKAAAGLSDQTVAHLRGLLRRALNDAVRQGEGIKRNAAREARLPARRPRDRPAAPPAWDPEEARKFLSAIAGERLEALWVLLLTSGLRRSEVLGLQWSDVDLEAGSLQVRRSLQRTTAGLVLTAVKTRSSERTVTLPSLAVEALARARAHAGAILPTAFVFTSRSGGPLEPRNLNRAWYQLLETHGLRPIRLHDLRHSYASLLIGLGATPREVMEALGHTSVTVTMDRYAHAFRSAQTETAAKLDRLLRENSRG